MEDLPCSSSQPEADHFPLQLLPPKNTSSSYEQLASRAGTEESFCVPATSLALLSWSEQVSPPHTRCSKGSPLGEAPISCYSHPHLPHETLPARNPPSSLLHSPTTSFGSRFNITPCPEVVSSTKTASNQQTRILGPCSHSPASKGAHPPPSTGFQRCSATELLLSTGRAPRWGVRLADDWSGSNPNPQAKGCLNLIFGTIKDEARETRTCTVILCIKLRFLTWIQIQL